jgi:hypothetical protein
VLAEAHHGSALDGYGLAALAVAAVGARVAWLLYGAPGLPADGAAFGPVPLAAQQVLVGGSTTP